MPARIRKFHQDEVRARIQVTQLVKVLEKQALDLSAPEISPVRLKAIELLLRKSLPDVSSVQITGADGGPVQSEQHLIVSFR